MIIEVPTFEPVIIPVNEEIVAFRLLLLHVPPGVTSLKFDVRP